MNCLHQNEETEDACHSNTEVIGMSSYGYNLDQQCLLKPPVLECVSRVAVLVVGRTFIAWGLL